MKIGKNVNCILAISVFVALLCGCAKNDDTTQGQSDINSVSNDQSSTVDSKINKSEMDKPQASTPDTHTNVETEVVNAEDKLQMQRDDVRQAFISLQEACKTNDIDKYIAFWDDETKMAIDGRNLNLDERRESRRARLMKDPGRLQQIADAKIESITIDTSKAEGIKSIFSIDLEGTMMLVHTDGPDLFFHETDKGWKLNSIHGSR